MNDVSSSTVPASPARSTGSMVRMLCLGGLLAAMLLAAWYEHWIARPAVVAAYEQIASLNQQMNSKGGRTYMTEKDVQAALNRQPVDTFVQDGYYVEVYGWRAGLPIRRHNLFAIYTEGTPHAFLMHQLDEFHRDQLAAPTFGPRTPAPEAPAEGDTGLVPPEVAADAAPAGEGGRGGRRGGRRPGGEEGGTKGRPDGENSTEPQQPDAPAEPAKEAPAKEAPAPAKEK